MDVNEHNRLSNITLRHKIKQTNSAFSALLYFTVTVRSSVSSVTHTLKWVICALTENVCTHLLFAYWYVIECMLFSVTNNYIFISQIL